MTKPGNVSFIFDKFIYNSCLAGIGVVFVICPSIPPTTAQPSPYEQNRGLESITVHSRTPHTRPQFIQFPLYPIASWKSKTTYFPRLATVKG